MNSQSRSVSIFHSKCKQISNEIKKGLTADESKNPIAALNAYNTAKQLIKEAMQINSLSTNDKKVLEPYRKQLAQQFEFISSRTCILYTHFPLQRSQTHTTITSSKILPAQTSTPVQQSQTKIKEHSPLHGIDKKIIAIILNDLVENQSNISWNDITGLEQAKKLIMDSVILPQARPDLFTGLRSPAKGILLFGPPGNGKTMLARAIASECQAKFFTISASSITSKYHGESEKLVQGLFAVARSVQPSIIFIDEVDSILSSRSSNEHEATRRVKTEFLVQMDGIISNCGDQNSRVLVLGATNRPFDLDDAVLRRFPKRVLIPLPDEASRKAMFELLLSKEHHMISTKELDEAAKTTVGYSASDINNVCTETAMAPIRELPMDVILTMPITSIRSINILDLKAAISHIKPSVNINTLKLLLKWNKDFGT